MSFCQVLLTRSNLTFATSALVRRCSTLVQRQLRFLEPAIWPGYATAGARPHRRSSLMIVAWFLAGQNKDHTDTNVVSTVVEE